MLVNLAEILKDTRQKGYAVGLFNCVTLEMTRGILLAAEALQSPVIIGPAESLLPGAPLEDYADMMRGMAARARVPVALHFDHGFTPELVKKAVDLGFTSVMFDGSMLPFADNARLTRELGAYARRSGCSIEAEIGHVGSNGSAEDALSQSVYTEPDEALRFAMDSGCDALAIAIGTAHGVYREAPRLSYDALSAIANVCSTPLVLHGGSGLTDEAFQETIRRGISKINIFTHNNLAAARAAHDAYTGQTGAFELMGPVTQAVQRETMRLIRVFGSDGKA